MVAEVAHAEFMGLAARDDGVGGTGEPKLVDLGSEQQRLPHHEHRV